ncbi:MAG: pyridoxamine 5'-phosphate oxidase family protein [Actinomycetota bacterium]|nr:pyridoxamine 5'-phosphate oxidase family protein [Actinomycetota bacterium]
MRSEISTVDELHEVLGQPLERVLRKDRATLAPEQMAWLRESPFCLLGTSAADGTCDVSPKGDPAGFVHVIDAATIAIPERPGNKRADGYRNILENPHVGLLFMVPGRGDTLRINGRATILADAPYFDELVVKTHRPQLVVEVAIDQIFFHCAKAFLRSSLWKPESWHPERVPSRAAIAKALERPDDSIEELEAYYGKAYSEGLY